MGLNVWGGENIIVFILMAQAQASILTICMPLDLRQIHTFLNIPHVSKTPILSICAP